MEVDYIENFNGLEENLVRLYNFDKAEAIQFRDLLVEKVINKKQKLDLAELDFVVQEIRVNKGVSDEDFK